MNNHRENVRRPLENPPRPGNQMTTKNLVWFFVGFAIFFGLIILVILANMPDVTNAQP